MLLPSHRVGIYTPTSQAKTFWIFIIQSLPNKFFTRNAFSDDKTFSFLMMIPPLTFISWFWSWCLNFYKRLTSKWLNFMPLILFFLIHRVMMLIMFFSCYNNKVFNPIIFPISIYMMNNFILFDFSTRRFNYISVFWNKNISNLYSYITIRINSFSTVFNFSHLLLFLNPNRIFLSKLSFKLRSILSTHFCPATNIAKNLATLLLLTVSVQCCNTSICSFFDGFFKRISLFFNDYIMHHNVLYVKRKIKEVMPICLITNYY